MVPSSDTAITASAPPRPSAVEVVPSIGSTAMSALGGVPSPIRSPLKSIGASSFSPSPMTTTPSMAIEDSTIRMAFTAAPSAPFLSPRPIQRDAASAEASVTRTSSMARLRSGACWVAFTGTDDSGWHRWEKATSSGQPLGVAVHPYAGRMTDEPASAGFEAWHAAYASGSLRDADFETMSGVPLDPVYGPDGDAPDAIGWPGQFPYTRGPYAPMCEGEVGRCGVAVDTLADTEDLFDGIDLGHTTTSMTINSPAPMCFAMYVAAAEAAGTERRLLGGTLQNDMLKEYQAQKEYIFPPRPSMRLVTDVIRFCSAEMPRFHPVSVSGYHIREAGSTAAHELAFTLANGFAYVEAARTAGLGVDEFAPRLSFFFNAHIDFFEEIAKYRAAST